MEIRDAHPDEHDEIGRLMVEAYACLDGFPKPSEQPAYYAMLERIGKLVDPPATRLLAAIDGDRVLGAVLYIEEMTRYGAGGVADALRIARGLYERLGFRRAPELDFHQESLPVLGFRLRRRA